MVATVIHGNEKSGREAFKRFFRILNEEKIPIRAHIVGIQGNIKAWQQNVRYTDEDLNRLWTRENIRRIRAGTFRPRSYEEHTLVRLVRAIRHYRHRLRPRQFIWLDLHCTSSPRGTFVVSTRHHANLFLSSQLHIPLVLGLDHILKGTAIRFFSEIRNAVSLAIEGGRIGDPRAVEVHHATLWMAMKAARLLPRQFFDFIVPYEKFLMEIAESLPHKVLVQYAHFIDPTYHFKMLPGFKNFDYVRKGTILATQWDGPVYAPISGYLLMPLYQPQGGEGFYIAREIKH